MSPISVRPSSRVWAIMAYVLVLALAVAAGWRLNHPRVEPSPIVPVRIAAIPGNPVLNSTAVSPNGAYLAYSGPLGIGIYEIETTDLRRIPSTAGLNVTSWPANGMLLAADAAGGEMRALSPDGASKPTPTRDVAIAPDGAHAVVLDNGQYRIRDRRGRAGASLLRASPDTPAYFAWSPDGRYVAYATGRPGVRPALEIHVADAASGTSRRLFHPLPDLMISGLVWLPGGRIVFSAARAVFTEAVLEANLWKVALDPETARPAGRPEQLTQWSGFMIENLTASADGSRITYLRSQLQMDAYVAETEDGGRKIRAPRRLTMDERNDMPLGWMPDGRSVVFVSDRLGRLMGFRQRLDSDVAEPLTAGPLMSGNPRVVAGGKWILYIAAPPGARSGPLMRMPATGGPAVKVLDSVTAEAQYRCTPSGLCIISDVDERREKRITWEFSPITGKGRELFRTSADDGPADLSVDGKIAYVVGGRPRNRIRVLSLDGAEDRMLAVPGARYLNSLDWAADGRGLYTGDSQARRADLVYAGLNGVNTVVWTQPGSWQTWAVPSLDGKRIAMLGMSRETGAWMIEGLR